MCKILWVAVVFAVWTSLVQGDVSEGADIPSIETARVFRVDLGGTVAKALHESYVGVDAEDFAYGADFSWLLDPDGGRDAFSKLCRKAGMRILRFAQFSRYSFRGPDQTHELLKAYFRDPNRPYPTWWFAPEDYYSFCRENDIKIIGMFDGKAFYDNTTGQGHYLPNDPSLYAASVKEQEATLQWVIDNKYDDLVVGWELGNEPYFHWDPVEYADYVKMLTAKVKAIDPDIRLGISGFVCINGSDAKALRERLNAQEPEWPTREYQQYQDWLQWSASVFTALGDKASDIYWGVPHLYGGPPRYNATYKGLVTHDLLFKEFPNTRHFRMICTEWRHDGSGLYKNRIFRVAALWKAKFVLLQMAYPNMDYTAVHSLLHAGLMYYSDGEKWAMQGDIDNVILHDTTGDGNPRIDIGPFAPVMYMCNTLIDTHPYLLSYGADNGNLSSAYYYADDKRDLQWFIATNQNRDSIAGIFVNTHSQPVKLIVSSDSGVALTHLAELSMLTCDPDKLNEAETPGEPKWWRFETIKANANTITLPAHSVTKAVIPVKNGK